MLERNMVVPLKKARRGSSRRYAPKAIAYLRKFVARHMKAEEVLVGAKLNEVIWERGITNPPRRVEVKAVKKTKGDLVVFVEIASISEEAMNKFVHRGEEIKKDKKKAEPKSKKDEGKEKKKEAVVEKPKKKVPTKAKKAEKPKPKKAKAKSVKKPATKAVKKKLAKPSKKKAKA